MSPELGVLDEAAVSAALEEDADETLAILADMTRATDEKLRSQARRLAARLFIDIGRDGKGDTRGVARLVPTRYLPDAGDLDLDRSLDAIAAGSLDANDLTVTAWKKQSTAWCLVVDRSGSMHGRPLATAALAAAAVAFRAGGDYAVLFFGRDVVAAKAMWEQRSPSCVLDRVLSFRGHGTTDVARGLGAAADQFARSPAARRITVLLSDCRQTEPGDLLTAARALDELVIIAPAGDSAEAQALADAVGARWATISGPSSISDAFANLFDR